MALGVSRAKCYALIAAGELPMVFVGSSRRIPIAALEEWIEKGMILAQPLKAANALLQQIRALPRQWQAKGAQVDTSHATMGIGYKACAAELDRLLSGWTMEREEAAAARSGGRVRS